MPPPSENPMIYNDVSAEIILNRIQSTALETSPVNAALYPGEPEHLQKHLQAVICHAFRITEKRFAASSIIKGTALKPKFLCSEGHPFDV
jgi:hypothetical protein